MGKRKYSKKYGRKSSIKRRHIQRRKKSYKYRPLTSRSVPSGLPVQRVAKLRYATVGVLTCSTGIMNEVLFRANGPYDPEVAAGGSTPMSWTTYWQGIYNHQVVLGAKIWAKIVTDSAPQPSFTGLYLSDGTSTLYTTAREYVEARKGTNRMISPLNDKMFKLTNNYSAKRFYNVKDVKDNMNRLGSATNAVPTEQAYFHLWHQTLDSSTDSIRYSIVIDYIVLFSEPKDIPA